MLTARYGLNIDIKFRFICLFVCLFVFGATTPQLDSASSFLRFLVSHNDAPELVRLLWTNDQLVAETSTI